jgi:hypothetical protein
MDGKSYPIANASVDANNLVISRDGNRLVYHQDIINLVPLVYKITERTRGGLGATLKDALRILDARKLRHQGLYALRSGGLSHYTKR